VTAGDDLKSVCDAFRAAATVTVAVHENPDLDAVAAAAGVLDILRQLGGRGVLRVRPGTRLPRHDWFLSAEAVTEGPPEGDTLIVVDSGSLARTALDLEGWSGTIVNIDHHPDNQRFGHANLVRPEASSASEIVAAVTAALGLTMSAAAATALYTGIAFDTGQFRHASTGAATFRTAAGLVEAGAEPAPIFRAVFEGRTLADLRLWARAVAAARPVAEGRALIATLSRADFEACGESDGTEGVVDSLRSVRGVAVAALVREQPDGPRTRVSMRSDGFDVGDLARRRGGGGHRQAAGFSSEESAEEVAAWLSTELAGLL
jgi:bifunctional oligoribonuclease and PAP phosphatase NrnA